MASGESAEVLSSWVVVNNERHGERLAVVCAERELTYAQLYDQVTRLAGALVALDVQAGDRVAILLGNTPEFVVSLFATLHAGAVAVPLNVNFKEQELVDYIADAQPKVIIAEQRLGEMVTTIMGALEGRAPAAVTVPEGGPHLGYTSLLESAEPLACARTESAGQDAVCQYSSGSTGTPKKIVRNHDNLITEARNFHLTVGTTEADRIIGVVPLFHTHGMGNCLQAAMYVGATLYLVEEFKRRDVLRLLNDKRITVFPGVPFMFDILADTNLGAPVDLSALRLCFSAGGALIRKTFDKFMAKYGVPVRQLYGSTEAGSVTINLSDDFGDPVDSVGLPMQGVEVGIFGEGGEPRPPGEVGSVGIKSGAMIDHYSNANELNESAFRESYFFPGDMGRKDEAGNLYITGRETLVMNVGGNKVDPTDVERVVADHPKVAEVVVVGLKSEYGEDVIKAIVVAKEPCEASEIVEHCNQRIADFKVPRIVEFRNEIPKSPLGKILRKYLM